MDNKIVSISKNKVIENEELYQENFSFLNKVVNYEMNTLTLIEEVYDGKTRDSQILELIYKEKNHVIWPILLSMVSIIIFIAIILFQNIYLILPTIILTALSIVLFNRYFKEHNNKINVILRVYKIIEKKEYISVEEMASLQKLIPQEHMLDLIRVDEMRIPMDKVKSSLRNHFLPFKDYKAMKQYTYIEEHAKEIKCARGGIILG